MTATSFHHDEPTLEDALAHAAHVQRVGQMVLSCKPPFVLGIHGDWGTGKTSFLKKLRLYLAGRESGYGKPDVQGKRMWPADYHGTGLGVETVWFEAWRYQFDPHPVVALLNEIRSHFTWTRKLSGESAKLMFASLMSIEEVTKKIGIQPAKIVKAGEKWEADTLSQPLPSQVCRDLLEHAIGTILKQGKKDRLVIFIDDLDRCRGDVAFALLEALKIYLSIPNCVVVLGLDWRNVRRAVDRELFKKGIVPSKSDDRLSVEAEDYLNKLCQSVYNLPLLSDPRDYVEKLLTSAVFGRDPLARRSTQDPIWAEHLCRWRLLPQNPRKIKAFVNGLALYLSELWPVFRDSNPDGRLDHRLALIVAYLKLLANDVFRLVESEWAFWMEMSRFCRAEGPSHDVFKGRKLAHKPPESSGGDSSVSGELDSSFPDPADETVFRAAKLICDWRNGDPPTDDEFNIYVRLRKTVRK